MSKQIVWTATQCVPVGSVVTIKLQLCFNNGTVTGSGFGLSSGGDQVIVYTGSNTTPNYINYCIIIKWLKRRTKNAQRH
jgi:hypothetical protein